ncbi:MAG: hypothetical protein U1A26_01030 [Candidatus Sungbacteria bacterium]|nr:hypothetical protein [Candidatus Sungbacteria bacterium]
MSFFRTHQKTLATLLLVLALGTVFAVLIPHALAQGTGTIGPTPAITIPTPADSVAGKALPDSSGAATGASSVAGIAIVWAVLFALQSILVLLVSWAGQLLNIMFSVNINTTPASIDAVIIGWTIVRDICNSLFLLIVLWIAFTIIFDIEGLGGKRLLFRVIIVALLINFSLTMVTAVFGLTNFLAKQFANNIRITQKQNGQIVCQKNPDQSDKMDPTNPSRCLPTYTQDIASFVMQTLRIQDLLAGISSTDVDAAKQAAEKSKADAQKVQEQNFITHAPVKDTLLASMGIQTAHAQLTTTFLGGCAVGGALGSVVPILGTGAGCLVGLAAVLTSGWFSSSLAGVFSTLATQAVRMGFNVVVLSILTFTFFTGAVTLLVRVVMMVMLAVVAPAAMMSSIIPGGFSFTSGWQSKWLNTLFSWAFFAPGYYFLIYLGLYMLSVYANFQLSAGSTAGQFLDNATMAIFVVAFFYLAGKYARKTGHVVAETAISIGQKAVSGTLAYATAGVATAGGAALRTAGRRVVSKGGRVEKASDFAARHFGSTGRALQRGTQSFIESENKDIDERKKFLGSMSRSQLVSRYGSAITSKDKMAALAALSDEGWAGDLDPRALESALQMAQRYGRQKDVLNVRPDLTKEHMVRGATSDDDAMRKIIRGIEDKSKINKAAATNHATAKALWENLTHNDLSNIGLKNSDLMTELTTYANATPTFRADVRSVSPQREIEFDKYFTGSLASGSGIGWKPTGWDAAALPPKLTVKSTHNGRTTATVPYAGNLVVRGGVPPLGTPPGTPPAYTSTVIGGRLPPNVRIDNATQTFVPIPGAVATPGTYDADIRVSDGTDTQDIHVSIRIDP